MTVGNYAVVIEGERGYTRMEVALAGALALTVVGFSFGSSSVPEVKDFGLQVRWLLLTAFLALALAAHRGLPLALGPARDAVLLAGASVALALASAAWSVWPELTVKRTATLAILLVAAVAVTSMASGRPELVRLLLGGILAGVAIALAAGVVIVVLAPELAVQSGTVNADRYRGLGENPNTMSMLAAVALPVVGWQILGARGRLQVTLAVTFAALFVGTIAASGSRGAIAAGFIGLLALAAMLPRWRTKVAVAVGAIGFALFCSAVIELSQPEVPPPPQVAEEPAPSEYDLGRRTAVNVLSRASDVAETADVEGRERIVPEVRSAADALEAAEARPAAEREKAEAVQALRRVMTLLKRRRPDQRAEVVAIDHAREVLTSRPLPPEPVEEPPPQALAQGRLEDELGRAEAVAPLPRLSLNASGRADAWAGAIEEGNRRPLLGYGFGVEDRVFVDRYYRFQGGRPENSLLGVYLQLGAVGLALFVALGVALVVPALRAVRYLPGMERGLAAACGAVVAAAIPLMFVQSFAYSVGNVATVTVWLSAFAFAVSRAWAPAQADRRALSRTRSTVGAGVAR